MDIQELRIGSWVMLHGKPHKISWPDSIRTNSMFNKPIVLTTELLLSIGAKSTDSKNAFKLPAGKIAIGIRLVGTSYLIRGHDYIELEIAILYLHQLQNLYRALTGKELEVRL